MLSETRRHNNDACIAAVNLLRTFTDTSASSLIEDFGGVNTAAISKLVRRSEDRPKTDDK